MRNPLTQRQRPRPIPQTKKMELTKVAVADDVTRAGAIATSTIGTKVIPSTERRVTRRNTLGPIK